MSYVVDKIFLLIITAFLMFSNRMNAAAIVAALICIIVSVLDALFECKKYIRIMTFIYGIAVFFLPELIYMMPVILYDIFQYKIAESAAINILSAFVVCLNGFDVSIFLLIIVAFLGFYINDKSVNIYKLKRNVKSIRDYEEEKNILLSEKNRSLIEKQDYEVYVATLKERNRIAREIHDNVGHILTRIILQIGALMTIHKEEPINGQLKSVKENLDIAMNNVRESVHDLHDESIDLKHSVYDIVAGLKDKFQYNIEYDINELVDKKYKYAIIGIIREAVVNVIKHSNNTNVNIMLREHPSMYQIIVHDYSCDNKNRDNADIHKLLSEGSGIGLQNIEDRVLGLGGHVSISCENGFRVFATLPRMGEKYENNSDR